MLPDKGIFLPKNCTMVVEEISLILCWLLSTWLIILQCSHYDISHTSLSLLWWRIWWYQVRSLVQENMVRMRPLIFSISLKNCLLYFCVSGVSHTTLFLVRATLGTSLYVKVCQSSLFFVHYYCYYSSQLPRGTYEAKWNVGAWQGGGQ